MRFRVVPHIVLPCCLLAWGYIANADPLEDYVKACEATTISGGWAATATCSAFLDRLSALANHVPEERLAMFKARTLLGHYSHSTEKHCDEFRKAAKGLLDRPDVLYEFALCSYWPLPSEASEWRRADEQFVSLLEGVLAIDPRHVDALDLLVEKVRVVGYDHGVDARTLARHATTLYETTRDPRAAMSAFEAALDARDTKSADAVRERVRRDLALGALDYGPQQRANSLALSCSIELFALGLEEYCLSAIETLAATAADTGESIPSDVLRHVSDSFGRLKLQARLADVYEHNPQRSQWNDHEAWAVGRKSDHARRLKAVLEAHPEPLRSSEHYRVYAATVPTWKGRVAALRRAVQLDGVNIEAKCELASALALTGERDEAWSIYADMASMSAGQPPCNPEKAMRSLEDQALSGVSATPVDPDEPVKFMIFR